jgi:hypothetical protein
MKLPRSGKLWEFCGILLLQYTNARSPSLKDRSRSTFYQSSGLSLQFFS